MNNETEIIKRTSITQMCAAWTLAQQKISEAMLRLFDAKQLMQQAFNSDGYPWDVDLRYNSRHYDIDDPKDYAEMIREMEKRAWGCIVNRIELRRVLSIARAKELDKQLESGEGLPALTEANILAMLETNHANVFTYVEEMVREVYDLLIPRDKPEHVTNRRWELGPKVILTYHVEWGYGDNYRVSHYRRDNLRAMDNVFHALDGKGTIKSWQGPFCEAIEKTPHSTGKGETDYFRFRCHKNGNLHIEFRQPKLVELFNRVAGGHRLKGSDLGGAQ